MAQTAAKGFFYRESLIGTGAPVIKKFRIGDTKTITHGDAVRLNTSGLIDIAGAGVPVLGVVVGLVDTNGINVLGQGYNNGTGATLTGDDTVLSASDNSTRASYVMAEVSLDVAGSALYYNDADGDLAQTNVGQLFDCVAASDQISQSTASDTSGSFQLLVIDPDGDADASKGLFRIVEHQLVNNVASYGSTAVVTA
jgi:hypothetical protein